ncbi:hypothetical protein CEP54_008919 [Fusarium duplospermum]|uniref:CCHC-type domain-containing protein n=1 Tax=Fusarium duplospermum TaxID=1325734 RepID=A0A428PTU8_9HYPO|nr:hypothetical protein CEP54_008919 [Fusarium duplospermum]
MAQSRSDALQPHFQMRCHKCQQFGHGGRDCPQKTQERRHQCRICFQVGHKAKEYPDRVCHRCHLKGHVVTECEIPWCGHCRTSRSIVTAMSQDEAFAMALVPLRVAGKERSSTRYPSLVRTDEGFSLVNWQR